MLAILELVLIAGPSAVAVCACAIGSFPDLVAIDPMKKLPPEEPEKQTYRLDDLLNS